MLRASLARLFVLTPARTHLQHQGVRPGKLSGVGVVYLQAPVGSALAGNAACACDPVAHQVAIRLIPQRVGARWGGDVRVHLLQNRADFEVRYERARVGGWID